MPPPGQRVQNVVHGKRRKQAVQPCRSGAITARRIHAESRSSLIPRNLLHGSHPALVLFFFLGTCGARHVRSAVERFLERCNTTTGDTT